MPSATRRTLLGGRRFQQQATPPSKPPDQPWDYTPPPIPQPLPAPGGPITPVVGAAPSAGPANTENPAAGATPATGATPAVVIPVNPSGPPQPAGATPAAAASPTPAPSATVTLTPDFTFDPAQVTIASGQAVQWVNQGRAPQTVTNDPARAKDKSHAAAPQGGVVFDSGVLNAGAKFTQVFDVAGTYSYFSQPQEQAGMLGTVVVQ